MALTLFLCVLEFFVAGASISTPVNANGLWDCLVGNPNQEYIASGFRRGFCIGIGNAPNVPVNNADLKVKKSRNRSVIIEKMNTELRLGRILGPYSSPPVENATYSPLVLLVLVRVRARRHHWSYL